MLVSELKKTLGKYKKEELILIITEMYKFMPKKLREEKDIDSLLKDAPNYIRIGKGAKAKDMQINMDDLKQEIDRFIDHAYKQYYFAPNNVIHKKDRPKWRFKVKNYIKTLQNIAVDGDEGSIATGLLAKLYEMLCYACGYYLFNTEAPFRSVGIEQEALLDTVIERRLSYGINQENVKFAIELVTKSIENPNTVNSSLIYVLVKNLKTADAKEMAIEQCKLLLNKWKESKKTSTKKSWSADRSDYELGEKNNLLAEMVFRINIALCEFDEAIQSFKKYYASYNAEVNLYVLLKLLWEYELKDLWMREYEEALKKGLKPRENLRNIYKFIQENNCLPESFYIYS